MGRSNIAVSDEIAHELSRIAQREHKTSYALANESLEEVLKIFDKGGNADEIYGAWIMNRIGKDVRAFQFIGQNLMERLVKDFGRTNPEQFSQLWYDSGHNFAVYLQMCFPTIRDVVGLMDQLKKSYSIGKVELSETSESDGEAHYSLKIIAPFSSELVKYLGDFARGFLSAYGLEEVESIYSEGAAITRFIWREKLTAVEPPVMR